jgi:hypothetical protein
MNHKFSYGDLVIGNEEAQNYTMTTKGTEWVVVNTRDNNRMLYVMSKETWLMYEKSQKHYPHTDKKLTNNFDYDVIASRFDFVKNLIDLSNKAMSHVLEKYDD